MFKWMKNHNKISMGVIIFLFLFFIIIMPFILDKIYYLTTPCDFFKLGYSVDNILEYYGAILTFIGTLSLGIITVYQNYMSQKKTYEINNLTLELQKKSMAMAEQNYEKEKLNEITKRAPKFELRNSCYNGNYMNICALLKNVSNNFVSGIKSISLEAVYESNYIVLASNKVKSEALSLSPGQEIKIEFHNSELGTENKAADSSKKVTMTWSFQCEDSYSNTHYYKATLSNAVDEKLLWKVEKVG